VGLRERERERERNRVGDGGRLTCGPVGLIQTNSKLIQT
jgi:hypothetical protein